jgi:O-antigen/teichoic acid export membrane protein
VSDRGPAPAGESELLDTPEAGPTAVRGAVLRVAGYAAGVLMSVGSAALLFRHLGVEDGGRYVSVLALVGIVAGVTEVGMTMIGVRELAVRHRDARAPFIRSLLGLRLVLTLVGICCAVVFAVAAGYDETMVAGTVLAGLGVVAFALQSTLGIALHAALQFGWVTLLELVRQALTVAAIVTLVLAGAGLLPFFALTIPVGIAVLALTAWVVRSDAPLLPSFRPAEWRSLLREVLPFAAATIIAAVYFRAAMIVLSVVSTPTETGYFAAPFRITEVLLIVPNLVVGAAFPIFARAARDDHDRLAYGVDRVFQACVVLGGLLFVALLLGAPFAIDVVAGEDFAPSVDVLQIQAAALALAFPNSVMFYVLLTLRRYSILLGLSAGFLVVNVVLAAVLGDAEGAEGAAVATVVAELAGLFAGYVAVRSVAPHLAPGLAVVPKVVLAAGGGAVLLASGLSAFVAACIGVVVYAAIVLALRAVPRELLESMPLRAPRAR